jgi:hypothetical protein
VALLEFPDEYLDLEIYCLWWPPTSKMVRGSPPERLSPSPSIINIAFLPQTPAMKRRDAAMFVHRLILSVLIVASMATASSAAPIADSTQRAPRQACATVQAYFDPNHAKVGQKVSTFWEVDNCSNHSAVLRIVWRTFGPCADTKDKLRVSLDAGMGFGETGFFTPDCTGVFKLRVKAFKRSVLLTETTAKLKV